MAEVDSPHQEPEPLHRRLDAELADHLVEPALRCDDRDVRDLERSQVVRVSAFDVSTAARCQTKAAATPEPFEPSIFTTTRAVALRSVRWLRRTDSVVEAVSLTMRQARRADRGPGDSPIPDDDWLGQYLGSVAVDVRTRIAARSTTWLTTTLTALGVDQPAATQGWRFDLPQRWRYPGRGLALDGKVDLALPSGPAGARSFTPVFVATSLHPATMDQAAFNICLWTINQRRSPDEVGLVELPTATVHWLSPGDLYQRGIQAAAKAAYAVTQRGGGLAPTETGLTFGPSPFTCQGCFWAPGCQARIDFQQQPVQKGGVRLTT